MGENKAGFLKRVCESEQFGTGRGVIELAKLHPYRIIESTGYPMTTPDS